MLVDCPKCNFSQPADQYCAKCGVDMQSYVPKPPSVGKRLSSNPLIPVVAIFILVFAGALYIIREQREQEITRRMDYLKNGPVFAETTREKEASPAAAPVNAEVEPRPASAVASDMASEEANTDNTRNMASPDAVAARSAPKAVRATTAPEFISQEANLSSLTGAEAQPTESPVVKAKSYSLKVQYLLAPMNPLVRLVEASRSQSQFIDFGEFQMGTIRNLRNMTGGLDVIENVTQKFPNPTSENIWNVGGKMTNENQLGLVTKITLRGMDGENLRGEIEILRTLHESDDRNVGAVAKGFGPGEFELPPGAALMVILDLPNHAQYDERNLSPTGFLRIFRMPEFKRNQAKFLMLFEFE